MKKIKWIFVGLLLMFLAIPVNASVYRCDAQLSTSNGGSVSHGCFDFESIPSDVPYTLYSNVYDAWVVSGFTGNYHVTVHDVAGDYDMNSGTIYEHGEYRRDSSSGGGLTGVTAYEYTPQQGGIKIINVLAIGEAYTLSGSVGCISGNNIKLYVFVDPDWVLVKDDDITASNTSYSYNINYGAQYKIYFSDGVTHTFTCTGDEIFNYDNCLYVYGYTCNIDSISLWKYEGGSWVYQGVASQWRGYDTYEMRIVSGYDYRLNFSDGHTYVFTCAGNDVRYDWDRCAWADPPSPYQPPEIIQPILGYDNNIVFMRDSHGNFIKNSQIAVYNKANHTYNQKWADTLEPYVLLAANNDSDDDVIVMCKTFDGIFTLETTDPAFGTDENITWTNWTIPIMYNLEIRPIDQSNVPLHDVFVSMYEYTPLDPLSFFGYDTYWGHMPITNCSGFSRCDIVAGKGGYTDYNITGLNWTSKSAMVKNYKHDIVMVKE